MIGNPPTKAMRTRAHLRDLNNIIDWRVRPLYGQMIRLTQIAEHQVDTVKMILEGLEPVDELSTL